MPAEQAAFPGLTAIVPAPEPAVEIACRPKLDYALGVMLQVPKMPSPPDGAVPMIPILVKMTAPAPGVLPEDTLLLAGGHALVLASPADIEMLERHPDVASIALAGTNPAAARAALAAVASIPEPPSPRPELFAGIVDEGCSRAGEPIVENGFRFAVLRDLHASPPLVELHGRLMAELIHKKSPRTPLVAVDTPLDEFCILAAVDFLARTAAAWQAPAVACLSVNTSSGPHDGTSLFEEALSAYVSPLLVLFCSSGNQGSASKHARFTDVDLKGRSLVLPMSFCAEGPGEAGVELWFSKPVLVEAVLTAPDGVTYGPVANGHGRVYRCANRVVALCNDTSRHPNGDTFIAFTVNQPPNAPAGPCNGQWELSLRFSHAGPVACDAWMATPAKWKGYFQEYVDQRGTMQPPATARDVVAVGTCAPTTGLCMAQGPTRDGRQKPDIYVATSQFSSTANAFTAGCVAESYYGLAPESRSLMAAFTALSANHAGFSNDYRRFQPPAADRPVRPSAASAR